ncbi:MAG: DUF1697 domain-containing protein [Gemmatimonadales bacterium]
MRRHVAFLRAINVGGHVAKMDTLRSLFTALGLKDVETFIASGNVVFASRKGSVAALETRIEQCLEKALGYEVSTFIRDDTEIASVAEYEPFAPKLMARAKRLYVGFLKEPLSAAQRKKVLAWKSDVEDFHVNEREVYWLSRVGQSESKFNNAVFERAVTRATWRGMKTVRNLVEKYGFGAGDR